MQIDTAGSGPQFVLVHSLLTDARAFDYVTTLLSPQHEVIRFSLPGFGTTPALQNPTPTIFDLANSIAAALDEVGVGPDTAVLGNGLGAFVCLALAIAHGDKFGPLIIANGGAAFSPERQVAFTTMSELVTNSGMEAVVDVAVKRIFPEPYIEAHPEVIDERREVLVKTDALAFAAACRALRDMDLTEAAGGISNPTLVIAGEADATTPPEMARDLASRIPHAELVELAGCGHCPPLEQPDAFVQAIEDFLSHHQQCRSQI